jgi:hypothetical protein
MIDELLEVGVVSLRCQPLPTDPFYLVSDQKNMSYEMVDNEI